MGKPDRLLGNVTALVELIPNLGCDANDFSGFTDGHIALISRGDCSFSDKVNLADDEGAVGVLIFDTEFGQFPGVSHLEPTFIPSLFITYALGTSLSEQLDDRGVEVRISVVPEPGTLALLGLSLAGLAAARRRTK